MSLDISVDQLDVKGMAKKFKTLPDQIKRVHLLRAERSAGNPLRRSIKNDMKQQHNVSGNLWKSIGNKTGRSKENPQIFIGARIGKGHKGHHAHWIEMGTADRIQRSTGRRVGKISPDKVVAKAYNEQKGIVAKKLASEVSKQMDKAIRKHFGV